VIRSICIRLWPLSLGAAIVYMPQAHAQSPVDAATAGFGTVVDTLLYGALFGLAAYELLLGSMRRAATHLYCAAATLLLALLSLAMASSTPGWAASQPWLAGTGAPHVLLALSLIACLQFSRRMLDTPNKQVGWDRTILAAMALAAAIVSGAAFANQAMPWIEGAAMLASVLAIAGPAVTCARSGNRAALALLAAVVVGALSLAAAAPLARQGLPTLASIWIDRPVGILMICLLLSATNAQRIFTALESSVAAVRKFRTQERGLRALVLEQHATILNTRQALDTEASARANAETNAKNAAARLALAACDDEVTGVANRTLFCRQVEVLLARALRRCEPVVIFIVEFETDPATGGCESNLDHALFVIAQRLKLCMRAADIVGRTGPTQLAIAATDLKSERDVAHVVRKIRAELAEPIALDKHALGPLRRVGHARFTDQPVDVAELLRLASLSAEYTSVSLYEESPGATLA
jgi:GGDEF domain-containing protein